MLPLSSVAPSEQVDPGIQGKQACSILVPAVMFPYIPAGQLTSVFAGLQYLPFAHSAPTGFGLEEFVGHR